MGTPKRMFIIIPNDDNFERLRSIIPRGDAVFVSDVPALDKKALIVMLNDANAKELKRIIKKLEADRKVKVIDLLLVKGEKIEGGS